MSWCVYLCCRAGQRQLPRALIGDGGGWRVGGGCWMGVGGETAIGWEMIWRYEIW